MAGIEFWEVFELCTVGIHNLALYKRNVDRVVPLYIIEMRRLR